MTINSAKDAVFNTAELMELVFLYMPSKDMWIARGVCRQFYNTTVQSKRVNDIMFNTSNRASSEKWILRSPVSASNESAITWPYFEVYRDSSQEQSLPTDAPFWSPVRLCRMLRVDDEGIKDSAARLCDKFTEKIKFNVRPGLPIPASWDRVLTLHPPHSATVQVRLEFIIMVGAECKVRVRLVRVLKHANGITLGYLFNEALNRTGQVNYWATGHSSWVGATCAARVIAQFEQEFGQKAMLDVERSWADFDFVVVPSEKEWDTVK